MLRSVTESNPSAPGVSEQPFALQRTSSMIACLPNRRGKGCNPRAALPLSKYQIRAVHNAMMCVAPVCLCSADVCRIASRLFQTWLSPHSPLSCERRGLVFENRKHHNIFKLKYCTYIPRRSFPQCPSLLRQGQTEQHPSYLGTHGQPWCTLWICLR